MLPVCEAYEKQAIEETQCKVRRQEDIARSDLVKMPRVT